MRLITIPISHYCERARWALDHAALRYREDSHLQGFHRPVVLRAGGRGSTPALVTEDGTLGDSADIVAFATEHGPPSRRLIPEDPTERAEVDQLSKTFADDFGVETRRLAYAWMLPEGRRLLHYNNRGAPTWERVMMRLTWPLMRAMLVRYLSVRPDTVERARQRIRVALDQVGKRLADERPFLLGDRFTAADLTFAAMAAPLVLPREYFRPLPPPEELPAEARDEVIRYREHPAGQFALRMFAERRPPSMRQGSE